MQNFCQHFLLYDYIYRIVLGLSKVRLNYSLSHSQHFVHITEGPLKIIPSSSDFFIFFMVTCQRKEEGCFFNFIKHGGGLQKFTVAFALMTQISYLIKDQITREQTSTLDSHCLIYIFECRLKPDTFLSYIQAKKQCSVR